MLKFRTSPPVCLMISIFRLCFGSLRLSKHYLDRSIKMQDDRVFRIFRHITTHPVEQRDSDCVFIVSFKFSHLSFKANKKASIVPMLLITGFPGFISKMYAVNEESGYWQGMYQWRSIDHLEAYKKSFVFKMMNKRAEAESILAADFPNQQLIEFVNERLV